MSLSSIRWGVRIAAGTFGAVSAAYGGYAVRSDHADHDFVLRGLTLVLIVAGIWIIVEAIGGGFDQVQRSTQERYDHLEATRSSAYAIAAQTVLAMASKQAAEESDKVRVLHR